MRRRKTGEQSSDVQPTAERPRYCPTCGALNINRGLRCTTCGQVFDSDTPVETYWDKPQEADRTVDDQPYSAGYQEMTSPLSPENDLPDTEVTVPYTPVADRWSSSSGRLGADPTSPDAFAPPGVDLAPARGGPPGWLLGLFGILLIGAVAVAVLTLVVRPLLADRVESATSDAIVEALAQATLAPDVTAGTVVVTEQEINRTLRANQDDYRPVEDARIQIRRGGIEVTFRVYGVSGSLTGTVAVRSGKVVIADPQMNRVADQLIDVDAIARRAEEAINDLLKRNNLRPTAVTLTNNTLTITTEPTQ